jgi:UDP-galactopyranose mutase
MKYDYVIIGSGFFGAICAYELNKIGKKILVLEKRNHIGGNCYTENKDDINVHMYGPHIFHTSNKIIWDWLGQFVEFNNFSTRPVANYRGEIYSLPFSMWTFNKMWGVITPQQAREKIAEQSIDIENPSNLEEQALKTVGADVYHKLIEGYIEKQWHKPSRELPPSIIKRLPVRFTYDNNYYYDKYQGIPIGGYTQIFEKLLNGIEVKLNVDYQKNKEYWDSVASNIIYTGAIDRYFNYKYGDLEYKTLKFDFEYLDINDYQGVFMVSYTDKEIPYTRIIEHKHFEETKATGTWISKEYSVEFTRETEPYYPVNDKNNNEIYGRYKNLADELNNVYFGGRLAEYKYYDMHQVIESALNFVNSIKKIV